MSSLEKKIEESLHIDLDSPMMQYALTLAKRTIKPMVEQLAMEVAQQGTGLLVSWVQKWANEGKTSLLQIPAAGELTEEDKLTVLRRQAYDVAKTQHPEVRDVVLNTAIELALLHSKGNQSPVITPAPAQPGQPTDAPPQQ
jgi:hypothetical protein